jgi:cation diffusion facilitator CzcD-associated flavoprotein CzcO
VKTDVLILGGGTSAVSAALALAEMDVSCIVTEETDWIGGQLTSQAVPSDEHIWIEQFGSTRRYREFRNRLRKYYKENYHLSAESLKDNHLNPGAGFVSPICAEPRVIHDVLNSFLAPYRSNEKVTILLRHILVDADSDGGKVRSVRVKNLQDGEVFEIVAKIVTSSKN